jgi:hypothetical protein
MRSSARTESIPEYTPTPWPAWTGVDSEQVTQVRAALFGANLRS